MLGFKVAIRRACRAGFHAEIELRAKSRSPSSNCRQAPETPNPKPSAPLSRPTLSSFKEPEMASVAGSSRVVTVNADLVAFPSL